MKTFVAPTHLPRLVIATLLGPLAFGCAAVRTADDNGSQPRAHAAVKFTDLNLSSPDGAAALYGRICAAAYDVCGSADIDTRDLADLTGQLSCVHSAIRSAVVNVNHPALSAIYNSRNRDPLPVTVAAAAQND